jgi:hypothetical protein
MKDEEFGIKAELRFEDLEILDDQELGKGGYALVKLARKKGDDKLYAVKIVRP